MSLCPSPPRPQFGERETCAQDDDGQRPLSAAGGRRGVVRFGFGWKGMSVNFNACGSGHQRAVYCGATGSR